MMLLIAAARWYLLHSTVGALTTEPCEVRFTGAAATPLTKPVSEYNFCVAKCTWQACGKLICDMGSPWQSSCYINAMRVSKEVSSLLGPIQSAHAVEA